jgi:serine/threonine protein kinase
MSMTANEVTELSRLLDEAMAFEPPERGSWLGRLDLSNPEMARRLRAILRRMQTRDRTTLLPKLPRLEDEDAVASAGDRVGPYQLIQEIGRGGMGSVWLADRVDGAFKRRLALKLPRLVWAAGLARRMARERDISALLEHPHIARLYDAGVDDRGRPFIAMEHIDGQAIDVYCREHALDLRARLKLFVQVVRAVAYAHGQLIIHRDLKPANVLVDAAGQVHLLDFGIAKLLDGAGSAESDVTQELAQALSLNYASPEQIAGRSLGATADVYSLGVMLFELLTGSLPYHLKRNTLGAIEEAILAGDPPHTSERVKDRQLARALRGDVDAIVAKTIKLEPSDRYASADALATDIERYLDGQPVVARPDSTTYRLRKFLRRNRVPVVGAVVISMALVAGASVALWQARVASVQAEEAAALNTVVFSLIRRADPGATSQTKAADVAMLSAIEQHIDDNYKTQPERALVLRLTVGDAYLNRGEGIAAQRVFRKAADEASSRLSPEDLQLLTAQVRAADSRLLVSRESTARLDSAVERLRTVGPAGADLLIDALLIRHELGHVYGVPEFTTAQAAFATLDEAMGLATRHFGVGSRQHLRVVAPYSQALDLLISRAKANQLAEEALEAARMRGVDGTNTGEYRALQIQRLANSCSRNKDAERALPALWAIADEARAAHGENSSQLEEALGAMPSCYLSLLDPTGGWVADAAYQVAAHRENPPSPMLLRRAERSLFVATDSTNSRDYAAAERFVQFAEENSAAIIDPDLRHRRLRYVHMLKVCVLAGQGKAKAALEFATPIRTELDAEWAKVGRVTQWQSAFFRCVSFAQRQLGLPAEAKQTAQVFIDRCKAGPTASDGRCEAKLLLPRAEAEVDGGEYEAALLSLQERRKQPRGTGILSDHPLTGGRALLGLGRVAEALPVLQFAYGAWLASPDPRGHYAAEAEYWLALAYLANHDTRGRWMLAEARKKLATSPLQHHRNLAARRVPAEGVPIPKPAITNAVPASVAL